MRGKLVWVAVAAVSAVAAVASACGDGGENEQEATATPASTGAAPGAQVDVLLDEWSMVANPASVAAGSVTFTATNEGEDEHEMVVVKTDLASDALPVVDGKVDEEGAGEVIGEIGEFASGGEEKATFTLEPGSYVLFCNIVHTMDSGEVERHYEKGMHTAFTVTE